jgi:hypothetical protein
MPRPIARTASSVVLRFRLRDDDGNLLPSIAWNDSDLTVRYLRQSDTSWQTVTTVSKAAAVYVSGGWFNRGGGWYELGLPAAAIVPGERTDIEVTYGANQPQGDSIDAIIVSPTEVAGYAGAGAGDFTYTVTVEDDTSSLIIGARVTIQNAAGQIVRWGATKGDGAITFNLDAGDYTVLVSAGTAYESHSEPITLAGNDTLEVAMIPVEAIEAAEPTAGSVYRLMTAVDWILDLNIGSLQGVTWSELRFTLKAGLIDDRDEDAALQVKLTNPGHASDGLIVLNAESGADINASLASIEVLDSVAGTIRVTLKAGATDELEPTDPAQWAVDETRIGGARLWRRSEATSRMPPWYHFDAKRLDGNGNAATIQASGVIIAREAVTQHVE